MSIRVINAFLALCIAVSFFGCATADKKSAKELYDEAYLLYEDESYSSAKRRFEEVIEKDPLNKYAVKSELHLADIFYTKEDYEDSIIHYEEYMRLSPKTKKREYIFYRIAMCHFNLMNTYDRDQTDTELALKKFDEYLSKYPEGKYKDEVVRNMTVALKLKLESEYNVGRFYYKMEEYDAAKVRCENILKRYEKRGELIEETYLILARSLVKLSKGDELKIVYADYLKVFPDGKYKEDIKEIIK
jgi:outer membrane protein assembly factor BamD